MLLIKKNGAIIKQFAGADGYPIIRKIPRCRGENVYCDDKFLVSFTLCVTITLREEGAYG